MVRNRVNLVFALFVLISLTGAAIVGQDNAAGVHARRVLNLLRQEQFADVASEFNAKVAALMSAAQLRDAWTTLQKQAGPFQSVIDEQVSTPSPGFTAATLGCQFEKAVLNVMIAFDAQDKIAGLRIAPRPAPAEPATAPPASAKFKEEAVTVGSGEWALPGTLSLPDGPISGAVVLVHGSGPHDRDETIGPNKPFRDLAWGLADRGIAVLRYEKRTRQHPAKLAGNQNLTVREEVIDDALLAAALLRKHDRLDPKRVFILGHSLGGMLAPRIGAADPALAGLIILAGATRPLLDAAREQLAYLGSLNPGGVSVDEGIKMLLKAAPESYWKDLDSYNPGETAAKLPMPMLILQGERDYQVTMADLEGWRKALSGRSGVTIKSYPTLNHLFMPGEGKSRPSEYEQPGHIPEFVLDDMAAWIRQR
jgi:dienelactone hydrolase